MALFLYYFLNFLQKILPNTGFLFKGALISTLPLASCFLINFDFLLLHITYLDNIIALPLLVFETLGFMLSVFLFVLYSVVLYLIS